MVKIHKLTTIAPIPTKTSELPKTTAKIIRRKLISRTPPLSRRTTTTPETEISKNSSSENLDDAVVSVLPALTSVNTQRPAHLIGNLTRTRIQPFLVETVETTTPKETTAFDQILLHQYKIKGLDKDYDEEKMERDTNLQEEDEKLIGVLGSQVCIQIQS